MKIAKAPLIAASLMMLAPALYAETVVDKGAQKELALTIYQNGLGFVRDARRVEMKKGRESYVFEDISTSLIPDSLLMAGSGFTVLERQFDFDLISPRTLMDKSVGKRVKFRRFNTVTGKDETFFATLLSTANGVVIERDGKIEVGQPGQLVLDQMPEGLRARPAMTATLDATQKGARDLGLAYLSNGLNWTVSYSGEVNEKADQLTLRAWANLTNTSGVDYKNTRLMLAAGQVNRQSLPQPVMQKALRANAVMAMDAVAESMPAPPQAVGAVHLYSLPEKVSLDHNVTKQVALLKAQEIKIERVLTQRYSPIYGAMNSRAVQPTHPAVELIFNNESGEPLPAGQVRLYRKDQTGNMHFIGEDRLGQTPPGEEVKLHPGTSFDVTLKRTQTKFDLKGRNEFAATYEVHIRNAKKEAQKVRVYDSFPGEWSLESSSQKPVSQDANTVEWSVTVPAGKEVVLSYEVDVRTR